MLHRLVSVEETMVTFVSCDKGNLNLENNIKRHAKKITGNSYGTSFMHL